MTTTLTLKQLRYIEAAGRLGSIAAAAEALNISQSSITAAIDGFESELGFDIFTRVPAKGIQVAPAGVESLRLITQFLSDFREFETELTAIGGATQGTIRLACFATAAASFLPPALARFQKTRPGVQIELLEGNMDTVIDYLDEGRADIVFTYEEVTSGRHAFEQMVDLPHYALVSVDDPLAQRTTLQLSDLADHPMISLDLPRTRGYYSNLFAEAGLTVEVVHSSSSVEMIRTLVASGFGFSVLNAKPATYGAGAGGYCVLPLSDPLPARRFGIVTQARLTQPRVIREFLDHCRLLRGEGVFERMAVRATAKK